MGNAQIQAGRAYVALYADNKPLVDSMKQLTPQIKRQGEALARIGEATALTFRKGNAAIESTTDEAGKAQIALVAMAQASSAVSAAADRAMILTGNSTRRTADGVDKLVDRMDHVAPAAKGFASALGALASGNTTLESRTFATANLISLLKSGGPAAKPFLDAITGIVGKASQLEKIKPPPILKDAPPPLPVAPPKSAFDVAKLAEASNASTASSPQASTGAHTIQGLTDEINKQYTRINGRTDVAYQQIYNLIKALKIDPTKTSGSTKLFDDAALNALIKEVTERDSKKGNARGGFRSAYDVASRIHAQIAKASSGNNAGLFGTGAITEIMGAIGKEVSGAVRKQTGEISKAKVALFALGGVAGVVGGAIEGTFKSVATIGKGPLIALTNITRGLLGVKQTFAPSGGGSALQGVASSATWASIFGSKKQKIDAHQMSIEADADAIGEAFTRGWPQGIAKYAKIKAYRGILAGLRAASSPSALGGAALGGMLAGPIGAAYGLGIGKIAPTIIGRLYGMIAGTKGTSATVDELGNVSAATAPKLGLLQKGIQSITNAARGSSGILRSLGRNMGGILAGGLGAVASLSALASSHNQSARDRIDAVGHSATTQHRSVKSTSELAFAADATGTNLKAVDSGMDHFRDTAKKAAEGNETAIASLNKLGISADSLSKMTTDQAMQRLGQALAHVADPAERDRMAIEALGESGASLVPMLTNINKLRSDAQSSGALVSDKDVNASKEMSLAMANLKAKITAAWNSVAASSIRATTGWIQGATKFIDKNQAIVGTLLKVVAGVGAIAGGLILWGQYVAPMMPVIQSVGTAILALANPVGLVVGAIGAGVAAWMYFSESGRQTFSQVSEWAKGLYDSFMEVWGGIVAAVSKGDLALAGNIAWTSLKIGFLTAIQAMGGSWSSFMEVVYGAGQLVTDGISNAWAFVATAFRNTQNAIAKGMIALTGGISKLWAQVWAGMMTGFNNTHNVIGKGLLYLYGKATGRSDEDMKSDAEGMDQQTNHFNAEAEKNRQNAIGPEMTAAMAELDQMAKNDTQLIEDNRKAAIARHQALIEEQMAALKPDSKRIEDLRSELNGMIKQAKAVDPTADERKSKEITPETNKTGDKKDSVAGTFSAIAAQGLGGGNVMNKIEEHTRLSKIALDKLIAKQGDYAKAVERRMRMGGR